MNRIYKVVFNKTLGAYTAASELAGFKGKKSVKAIVAVGLAGLMAAGSVSAAGISGGKEGRPNYPSDTTSYTGTVDGSPSGNYAASGGSVKADGYTSNYTSMAGGMDLNNIVKPSVAANNNSLTFRNSTVAATGIGTYSGGNITVVGNMTSGGEANNNKVIFENPILKGTSTSVAGASGGLRNIDNGDISMSGNTAIVSGASDTTNYLYAAKGAEFGIAKDASMGNLTLTGNKAIVSGSTIRDVAGAEVTASTSIDIKNVTMSGNTATVSDSTVNGVVSAVKLFNISNAVITGNTLSVTDSEFTSNGRIHGVWVAGDNATVSGNTVNVKGNNKTTHSVSVFGAYIDGEKATATNNTVNLSGNIVFEGESKSVYTARDSNNSSTNTVSDNTVNVTGNVKLSNVNMYGRSANNQGSGNTLNLNNWQGKIKSVNYFDNVNVKTSSAEPEQVVIGNLVKGNADTRINIGLDGKASRELEEKTSTAEEAAIGASKVVKLEDVNGSAEHNEKFNVNIAEGDVSGEITAEVWEDGTVNLIVKSITEKENSVMKSLTNIAANNFLVFRSQMNDMDKRMGDLRTMPNSDGVWGRAVVGQSEYKQMHSTYKTLQVGADKRLGQFLVGATASYTDADGSLKNGSSDDKNYTYGIYGSWLGDNGHYVDVIVKRHHVQSDYDLRYKSGLKADGKMHTSGTSISAEYGKRFAITNTNFYVEPQVEVMWGKLDSDSYKLSNGVKISQDSIDSLVGRLGVAAGWVSPDKKGSAYIKASVLNDWEGDADIKAKKGATVRKYSEDMGGTWGEFAIGGTYNFCKNFSAYGEIETTAGNPVRTTYQASAGIRYSF